MNLQKIKLCAYKTEENGVKKKHNTHTHTTKIKDFSKRAMWNKQINRFTICDYIIV